jgi:outer membrane protein assembly factor BamD
MANHLLKKKIVGVVLIALLASACSKYNRLLKSNDLTKKYDAAIAYYDKKDYPKALSLFEELVGMYRGTDKAEKIMYYYAHATYAVGDYLLAGYHFNNFVKTYPASTKTEECAYMYAYCFYLESPKYSLDQTETKNAIKELQSFINRYPKSDKREECNSLITRLRGKMEMKCFEIAKQYYLLEDYKAAILSTENLLKDFPDTKYREEAMYMLVKANYIFAAHSFDFKKEERYKAVLDSYNKYASFYGKESRYAKDAEGYYVSAKKQLNKL